MVVDRQLDNMRRQMSNNTKFIAWIESLKKEFATTNNEKQDAFTMLSNVK